MKAWARVDAFVGQSHKIIDLPSDAVRWTWLLAVCNGKVQPMQGQWRSAKHLAGCIARPLAHVRSLIQVGLIEEHPTTGLVTVHDWDDWQSVTPGDPTSRDRAQRFRERQRNGTVTPLRHGQTETETETETEKNTLRPSDACPETPADADRSRPADPPDDPAVIEDFPCDGPVRTWSLRRSLAARLAEAYPQRDIPAEAGRAKAWLFANPDRRKTARGMPRFLNAWLARAQDAPRAAPAQRPQQPISAGAHTLNAAREAMRRKGLLDEPGRDQSPLRRDLEVSPGIPLGPTGA